MYLWTTVGMLNTRVEGSQEVTAKYPTITSFFDRFAARDRVKAYIARDVYAKKE